MVHVLSRIRRHVQQKHKINEIIRNISKKLFFKSRTDEKEKMRSNTEKKIIHSPNTVPIQKKSRHFGCLSEQDVGTIPHTLCMETNEIDCEIALNEYFN